MPGRFTSPSRTPRPFKRFLASRNGNFAVMGALLAPFVIGIVGGVVDMVAFLSHRSALQEAADSAALAAARETALTGWSQDAATAVASAHVQANTAHISTGKGQVTTFVELSKATGRVSVRVEQDHVTYFVAGYFQGTPQISVGATAQTSGSTNICVIGLNPTEEATVSLDSNAILQAPNCAVYSNSKSTSGMKSLSNAKLTSSLACTNGGFQGSEYNYSTMPMKDCPAMGDPLATRPYPDHSGACKEPISNSKSKSRWELDTYKGSLEPGIYCGGLSILGDSKITMEPGIYVMRDGPFYVDSNSFVTGVGVGMFFTGLGANFHFKSNVNVSLEAPTEGPMAGLIFFQDRTIMLDKDKRPIITDFWIESNNTRNLLGTIYLPSGNFIVKADNEVADQSAYTAIVVRKLQLFSKPRLVLNTDYDETTVPVPDGLRPSDKGATLVK